MKDFWNIRYSEPEYVYGKRENSFLGEQLPQLQLGKVLFPCEGEGRNAVFAAKLGWDVTAFDTSEIGKQKAMQLASNNNVTFSYLIENAATIELEDNFYDAVALIYAHFEPNIRKLIHQKFQKSLKLGGKLILEAFNPLQLGLSSGGPKQLDMLYDNKILHEDFASMRIDLLESRIIQLNEGKYHLGTAQVIRLLATKI